MSVVLRKIYTHRYPLLLMGIFLLGLFLRFRFLDLWMWEQNGYDESRDMLVARHIVEYGERIIRGPLAAGSNNLLMNSPIYYYFLAFLWFIGRSPMGVTVLWMLALSSSMFVAYRMGIALKDPATGLILTLLFAVHPEFVQMSQQLSQPRLIPLWMLVVLLLFVRRSHVTILTLVSLMAVIFVSMHIHYGALTIIPVLLVWLFSIWVKQRSRTPLESFVYFLLIAQLFIYAWIFVTYRYSVFDQLAFLRAYQEHSLNNFLISAEASIRNASSLIVPFLPFPAVRSIVFVVCTGILIILARSKRVTPPVRSWYRWVLVGFIVPVIITGLYNGHIAFSYLYGSMTIGILALGLGIGGLFRVHRIAALLCVMLLGGYYVRLSFILTEPYPKVSHYRLHGEVAKAIYTDYLSIAKGSPGEGGSAGSKLPPFVLATLSGSRSLVFDAWGTGSTWFWLEQYFDTRLVKLTNYGVNFKPLVTEPRYFYVICDLRDGEKESPGICLKRFTISRKYVSPTYEVIYSTPHYLVWRFLIVTPQPGGDYSVVHQNLLNAPE